MNLLLFSLCLTLLSSTAYGSLSALGGLECDVCKFFVGVANEAVRGSITREAAEEAAIAYCRLKHLGPCQGVEQCKDVCTGSIHEFAPEVIYIASKKYIDPETDCIKLAACKNNTVAGFNTVFDHTKAPVNVFNAKMNRMPSNPLALRSDVLRVLQVTDIHYQPEYVPGTLTECGEPNCCRALNGKSTRANNTAGIYGDYNCDPSPALMESLMTEFATLYPKPDFVLLTGDDPPHNIWNQSQTFNTGVSQAVAAMFKTALPGVPHFPILGNHNGFPVNQYNTEQLEVDAAWLYEPLADAYKDWLTPEALETFRLGGFYTMLVPGHPKLRIVAMNSNFHDNDNYWLLLGEFDTAGMISWFEQTMAAAERNGERCYVMMHHHPLSVTSDFSNWFAAKMAQYGHIINGAFMGHTHDDDMGVYPGPDGKPLVSFHIPSAVCCDGTNPSFRIYYVNATTGQLLDYDQYRVDLAGQGLINSLDPNKRPVWEHVYTATTLYNITSTTPENWANVIARFSTDDSAFRTWYFQYSTGMTDQYSAAEKKSRICSMKAPSSASYGKCMA